MPSKSLTASVSEKISGEAPLEETPAQGSAQVSNLDKTKAPGSPQWQVEDSQPTPFVSDFFLSHPDKVLGI